MLILTFCVDGGDREIPGIKEALGMLLEQWGDVKLLSIREDTAGGPKQLKLSDV